MNTIYKLVWNATTGSFVAASELAKGCKKKSRTVGALAAAIVLSLNAGVALAVEAKVGKTPAATCTADLTLTDGVCVNDNIPATSNAMASRSAIGTDSISVNTGPGYSASVDGSASTNAITEIAIGNGAIANSSAHGSAPEAALAVGYRANASGTATVALGDSSIANGAIATALGGGAQAQGDVTVAVGSSAHAMVANAVAVGASSNASGSTSVAIGASASASAANAVAIGANSVADRANSVSVGSSTTQRQIANVAAGTQANDVVNVSQLQPTLTALGATLDTTTGAVTGPSYTLTNGGTFTTVGAALTGLDTAVTNNTTNISHLTSSLNNGTVGLVQQSAAGASLTVGANTDGTAVNFTGTAGTRTLTGVANGVVSATSQDAVNGSQLHGVSSSLVTALGGGATLNPDGSITLPAYNVGGSTVTSVSDAITNIDGRVTTNAQDINKLADEIGSGTVGLVQQSAAGADLTVGANTDGTVVNFTGTAGARTLTGVADGQLTDTSTDAVNGSQLKATNDQVAQNIGDINTLNTNVSNLSTRVTNLDGRVTVNEGAITNLKDQLDNGGVGLVQQSALGANLTVGAATGGAAVDFTGTDGMRILTGVANGVSDDDAVTMSQLKAAGLYDPSGDPMTVISYDDHSLASATLGGTNGTVIDKLAPGLIAAGSMQAVNGGQLFSMQQDFQSQYDSLSGQIGNLDGRLGTIEQGIEDGTIGNSGPGGGDPVYGPGSGSGDNSLVVGDGADASGSNSTAVGNGAVASGDNSTATGAGAIASGANSTANSANAVASGSGSTAVGESASATGTNSTALGSNASATGNNSVALGAGSVADRDNTVSVGAPGQERQITNVAAGTQRTDAANWGQVQDAVNGVQDWANQKFRQIDKRINGMGAMSAASTQMAVNAAGVMPGNGRLSMGVGYQGGQSAMAVGYAKAINERARFSIGGAFSGSDANVGMGFGLDL
ncbi:transporter [Dyella sp. M7H15-1]|uniref:ESPR-type extended signal peptide-containing protein n=1 Tax=Dyella sp. M7H15-1 TaxID=2501295 RepID=UPI0010050FAC|nr:ESPR-type extended signal peptide-containing protein [Dyella sp. M7H15-1]QAU23063.1 transporter [Dyella sp. M7H15-1]